MARACLSADVPFDAEGRGAAPTSKCMTRSRARDALVARAAGRARAVTLMAQVDIYSCVCVPVQHRCVCSPACSVAEAVDADVLKSRQCGSCVVDWLPVSHT